MSPIDLAQMGILAWLLSGCQPNDAKEGWETGTDCPTQEFRDACDNLDAFSDFDRGRFADACERASRGMGCADGEMCLDAECIPELTDDSEACLSEAVGIDSDFVAGLADLSVDTCGGESWGEGLSSTSRVVRRDDGSLELFYGGTYDAGIGTSCFPAELAEIEFLQTDCVPLPRSDWKEVRHNYAVDHPALDAPLYTGESQEIQLGSESYTLTIGFFDHVLTYGPLAADDGFPPDRFEILLVRQGEADCISPTVTATDSSGTTHSFDSWAWEDTDFGSVFVGYDTDGGGRACDYSLGITTYSGRTMTLVVDDPSAAQGDTLDIGPPSAPMPPPPASIAAVSFIEDSTGVLAQSASGSATLDDYASGSDATVGGVTISYDDSTTASGDIEACFCPGLGR